MEARREETWAEGNDRKIDRNKGERVHFKCSAKTSVAMYRQDGVIFNNGMLQQQKIATVYHHKVVTRSMKENAFLPSPLFTLLRSHLN